jgi:hypothetical protein
MVSNLPLTGIVAVREALGLDTGMAIFVMIIALILQALVFLLLTPVLLAIFGVAAIAQGGG